MINPDPRDRLPWPFSHGRHLFWMVPVVAALLWQRWEMAGLAQWREDQATNLWIGSQVWHGRYFPLVGLISSTNLPNANGMVWLGFLLAVLPSLQAVGFALGVAQLVLLVRLCRSFFRDEPAVGWAAWVASASCLQVVLTGVEFWNQWVIGLVNLFFLAELRRLQGDGPKFWPLFWCVQCVLAAPALYLAGVVNSVCFVLLLGFVIWRKRIRLRDFVGRIGQWLVWAGAFVAHFCLMWLSYFYSVEFKTIRGLLKPFEERVTEAALTLGKLPLTVGRLMPRSMEGLNQDSSSIVGPAVYRDLGLGFYLLTGLLFAGTVLAIWRRRWPAVAVMVVFCVMTAVLSPLLGGFAWGLGERPDQVAQFFAPLVVAAFGAFALWPRLRVPVLGLAVLFAGSSFLQTMRLRTALLDYRGPEMTSADLPLADRRRAIDFVAADWKKHSDAEAESHGAVPIYYALGADWKWVVERFGPILAFWYADEPYTLGRAYDWELRRRWGLANQDEGAAQAARIWRGQRYTLSMVGAEVPEFLPATARHFEFGRVRVSVSGPP